MHVVIVSAHLHLLGPYGLFASIASVIDLSLCTPMSHRLWLHLDHTESRQMVGPHAFTADSILLLLLLLQPYNTAL